MKKKLLMALGVTAVAALSVNTTLAYLEAQTETIEDVYELGKVSVKQLEYERVVDEDGNWISMTEEDKYGYIPDKIQEFTESKPLLPAVYADGKEKWDDRNGESTATDVKHGQSWGQINTSGWNQLFDDSMKNVQDHFVFVENDGNTDAYVRTWFAFEQGSLSNERMNKLIHVNMNMSHWKWETYDTGVEITTNNGTSRYTVMVATYLGADGSGLLANNKISYPNLLQIFMSPEATNEDMVAIDGNGNGKYDVLVKTQAIQAEGFPNAATALAEFGTEHPF